MSRFSAAPASRLQISIVSMTRLKSPSVLCSTTGLPTLVNSSAPCPSDPAPLPNGPEEGRPVPGGKDRPRANHGEGRDRRAPSTWEAVRLREANWYPTRNVGASKAIQISANRAECVCHWIDHVRYERLPASSLTEGDVADVDRDWQPFGCGARQDGRGEQFTRVDHKERTRQQKTSPSDGLPKLDAMIHCALSWRAGRHFTLSSPAILFTEHAALCCKALGRMLIHPVGQLRCAHQAGLHRNVSEVRGGDGLLVAICRRRQTAEHGDDRDHGPLAAMDVCADAHMACGCLVPLLGDGIRWRKDAVVDRSGLSNKASSLPLGLWDKLNNPHPCFHSYYITIIIPSGHVGPLTPTSKPRAGSNEAIKNS